MGSASFPSTVMALNCLLLLLGLLPNPGHSCLPPPSIPSTSTTPSPSPSSTVSLPSSTSGATQEDQQRNCSVCTTSKGLQCQLPFSFDGQEFSSCTNHSDSRLWCATRVDSEGRLLRGVEAWDYCGSPCPAAGELEACTDQTSGKGFPTECRDKLDNRDKRILFLGNSYTYYNDLPSQVAAVAAAAGYKADVSSNSHGGWSLSNHRSGSLDLATTGKWDVVVLQDQSQRPSFPKNWVYGNVLPDAAALVTAIRNSNPCTVPVFFLTWGKRDGDSQNCANDNYFCSFEGIQERLTESYMTFAYSTQPARVAPVGEAWMRYAARQNLFVGDGSHPSRQGTYLAALTLFETIWGETSVGNKFTPEMDSAGFQEAAHAAVESRDWSWPQGGGPPCTSCLP